MSKIVENLIDFQNYQNTIKYPKWPKYPYTSKITNIPLDNQNYQNTPRNVFRCTTFRFIKFDSFHVLQILLILFKVALHASEPGLRSIYFQKSKQ